MTGPPESPGERARWACILEVLARKPGNVNRNHDFSDVHLIDFLRSAEAIAEPMQCARETGVGLAVLNAVRATRSVCDSNTNLGMILLLAPLAARTEPGRYGLVQVLHRLHPHDTHRVYEAIRLASPGGLGRSDCEDVRGEPTVDLVQAMKLARDRDLVARQYANQYEEIYEIVVPRIATAISEGRPLEVAIVWSHLELMAVRPDTLIARKRGATVAEESARRARSVLDAGWPDAPDSAESLREFDLWLRADGHARNPGTTADLVCAALFETLGDGTIQWPLDWNREFPQEWIST